MRLQINRPLNDQQLKLFIRQRTMLANAFRAHLAEFGVAEKLGGAGVDILILYVRRNLNSEMSRRREPYSRRRRFRSFSP
jgi:hypothetical protein